MSTIADKLTLLNATKTAIKQAIVDKGVEIADDEPFSGYAAKIASIPAGATTATVRINGADQALGSVSILSASYLECVDGVCTRKKIEYTEDAYAVTLENVVVGSLLFIAPSDIGAIPEATSGAAYVDKILSTATGESFFEATMVYEITEIAAEIKISPV